MENVDPPPLNQRWESGALCPLCGFILDLGGGGGGGGGGVAVHFILSKIIDPRL